MQREMEDPILLTSTMSKGDLAKTRLLEAALKIFGEKNLEGASVREIADEAGQNVSSIFYHFDSKENLYLTLLRGAVREIRNELQGVMAEIQEKKAKGNCSPEEALALIKQFLRTILVNKMTNNKQRTGESKKIKTRIGDGKNKSSCNESSRIN